MRSRAPLVALAAALLAACSNSTGPDLSGLPACGPATRFTVTPMALGDIREVAPLGGLNPPAHVFPNDHMGFYTTIGPAVPVVSPGTVRITQAMLQKRTGNGQPELDDYGLDFYPCPNQHFYFAHLSSLAPSFATRVGSLDGSCETPYMTGGFTYQQCRKNVAVDLVAGDAIGTAGGPGEGALDLGAVDADSTLFFVDPGRMTGAGGVHATCALNYFVTDVGDSLRARVAVNGVPRTAPPVCGSVAQDVANTAQGRWFFDATTHEDHHLALVHQSGDPTIGAFSIGTMLPGTTPTVLTFSAVDTGRVNRDFDLVTADGKIYCYQPTNLIAHVFVQLTSATQVKLELANGTLACGDSTVWAFSGAAATFSR